MTQTDRQTDRQTDKLTEHATLSVIVGCIYIHSTVTQPNNSCFPARIC